VVVGSESEGVQVSPLSTALQLIAELKGKIISDGEAEKRTFNDHAKLCSNSARDKKHEIENTKDERDGLEADIAKAESDGDGATARISELAASISQDEGELKEATALRTKEHNTFLAVDKQLSDTIETLVRAQHVLGKELEKSQHASSFLQRPTKGMQMFYLSLKQLVGAASVLASDDQKKVQILLQDQEGVSVDDNDVEEAAAIGSIGNDAAPASHSQTILQMLRELQDKTESTQAETRSKEQKQKHAYELIKLSFTHKIATETEQFNDAKHDLAIAKEARGGATGDIQLVTSKLEEAEKALDNLQHSCMDRANTFEASMQARGEEINALTQAEKILKSSTGGAEMIAYDFLQVDSESSDASVQDVAGNPGFAAYERLQHLAASVHSTALAQLASRLRAALRYNTGEHTGVDPFAKIKNMIKDLVGRLEQEARQDMQQKEFCDREMTRAKKNHEDRSNQVEDLTNRLESSAAELMGLQQDVVAASHEVKELMDTQTQLDKLRAKEHAEYVKVKKDLEEGLSGVRLALQTLRQYYMRGQEEGSSLVQTDIGDKMEATGMSRKGGAGDGIIGILEVVESDLGKSLAQVQSEEEAAVTDYEALTQENKILKATKEASIKHKQQSATSIQRKNGELESDRANTQEDLEAIDDYLGKLKNQCTAKPEAYSERKTRREAEMQGLQEALTILEQDQTGE